MRTHAVITAVAAVAVIGGGVALGSTQQQDPPSITPSPMTSATQIEQSLKQQCEQAVAQFRQKHPEGYTSGCNSGSGTLTVP
jgi:hypothetical protein